MLNAWLCKQEDPDQEALYLAVYVANSNGNEW